MKSGKQTDQDEMEQNRMVLCGQRSLNIFIILHRIACNISQGFIISEISYKTVNTSELKYLH